jgi:copper/silver efflux system protein
MLDKIILYFLKYRLITLILMIILISWGIMVSPFYGKNQATALTRVSVDALPDIGENQQIVFTEWPGRSPQDIEDQITNPLTSTLLGISGVTLFLVFQVFT